MRAVLGWMCSVDWDWELGEAEGGTKIYASKENLMERRKCVEEDSDHHPVEVVTMDKESFLELLEKSGVDPAEIQGSNIGPIIWTKKGFVG